MSGRSFSHPFDQSGEAKAAFPTMAELEGSVWRLSSLSTIFICADENDEGSVMSPTLSVCLL